jgi:hypothetical protein
LEWKTGVAERLNEFKATQSNKTVAPLLKVDVPKSTVDFRMAPSDTSNDWGVPIHLTQPHDIQQTTNEALMASAEAINLFVTQASQATDHAEAFQASTKEINSFATQASTLKPAPKHTQHKNIKQCQDMSAKPICNVPSQAMAFVQTRPEGPLHKTDCGMKALTRKVATTIAKKCTTSNEGRGALAEVGTKAAISNKENETSVKKASTNKRKICNKPSQTSEKRKARTENNPIVSEATDDNEQNSSITVLPPTCTYGCKHGGIIALLQMQPESTRHYLKEGNFFHNKACVDCKALIDPLFLKSKRKTLFYYCQVDFNVSNLDDDNTAIAAQSCDCILCLECYFKRSEKKEGETGVATGASGRRSSRRKT